MAHQRYHLPLTIAILLFLTIIVITPAEAAAPRIMLWYGGLLPHPVILSNWTEDGYFAITGEEPTVTPEELEKRPYIQVALFWGPEWSQYIDAGKPLSALRPEDANQHGRFYPAFGNAPAVIVLCAFPEGPVCLRQSVTQSFLVRESVTQSFLDMVARHGIPVHIDPQLPVTGTSVPNSPGGIVVIQGILLFVIGALVFLRWRLRTLHKPSLQRGMFD
jgi:hypothetical protein